MQTPAQRRRDYELYIALGDDFNPEQFIEPMTDQEVEAMIDSLED